MAARRVIVRQLARARTTFATQVVKSPGGYSYFLFGTSDPTKAMVMTEKQALKVLESWREERITNSNNCSIEPAPVQ